MTRIATTQTRRTEQSPSWDKTSLILEGRFVPARLPGFPFMEGTPKDVHGTYEIITADCTRTIARLDLSTQYRAEGIQWVGTNKQSWDKHLIAAWRTDDPRNRMDLWQQLDALGLCEHCGILVSLMSYAGGDGDSIDTTWKCVCGGELGNASFGYDRAEQGAKRIRWVNEKAEWTDTKPENNFEVLGITVSISGSSTW